MSGVTIPLEKLPSRGETYPSDMELIVHPITIKDQIDMDRYGISDTEYFQTLLKGVEIKGNFNKGSLFHSDVQFLDIVRRLICFDTKEDIVIEGCTCIYRDCQETFNYTFKIEDLEFEDFDKDIFNKTFKLKEGTEDELEFTVSPLTEDEYAVVSRNFNNYTDKKTQLSSMYTCYLCACIREVKGRTFKDLRDRNSFLTDYLDNITSNKDKKILKEIVDKTVIKLKPFKYKCPNCGRELEVQVTPNSNFQQ